MAAYKTFKMCILSAANCKQPLTKATEMLKHVIKHTFLPHFLADSQKVRTFATCFS